MHDDAPRPPASPTTTPAPPPEPAPAPSPTAAPAGPPSEPPSPVVPREDEPRAYLGPPPEGPKPVDTATLALAAALRALTPRVLVTPAIVIANLGLYVAMVSAGVHPLEPSGHDVLAWGGNFSGLTVEGEWWRLVSCTFLHFGALHLALNMWALWSVGRLVERMVGNTGFAALYLGAGLVGSACSLVFNPEVLSAGASGAVFGVFGALGGLALRLRRRLPPAFLRSLTRDAAFVILANLAFTFTAQGIDAAAHVGGLGAGTLFALLLAHPAETAAARSRPWRALAVAALAAALTTGGALFAAHAHEAAQANLREVAHGEQRALDRYQAALQRARQGELDDAGLAAAIEGEVVPLWREVRGRLEALATSGRASARAARTYARYMGLREEGWLLLAAALRERDDEKAQQARKKNEAAEALLEGLRPRQQKPRGQ